ncbi:YheC/YheD family protein [Caldalkalibacillus salinus]|uniref:YheC/YheD family endospore coat-associated protein n=1 Tax=Caldalkalibacillus salinus TaxID=2803787 RepID=UPI001920F522|nr:YheC/YheD family protein [Caldalkalibacillus salinus]
MIGIMKNSLKYKKSLTSLALAAMEAGFKQVVAFTPRDVHLAKRKIHALEFTPNGWVKRVVPFPSIIYDRGYYTSPEDARMAIRLQSKVPFVGYSMGTKLNIHRHLKKSKEISPYLIPTTLMTNIDDVIKALSENQLILKPVNGWGGRGIYRLEREDDAHRYTVYQNQEQYELDEYQVRKKLQVLKHKRYIMQPWLDIRGKDERIADHRVLIHKDHTGVWNILGIVTRLGPEGNVTSNVKSGGDLVHTMDYLTTQFDHSQAEDMYREMEDLSYKIASHLEKSYRRRFFEFGIDFAICRDGSLKLIEVNIKPGKNILKVTATQEMREKVFRASFDYAYHVINHSR